MSQPRAHQDSRNFAQNQFASFALRSLLVSGLMASGSMAGLSALHAIPHKPEAMIIRASVAAPTSLNAPNMIPVARPIVAAQPNDLARRAEEARQELAAASALTQSVTGAAAVQPDYGFTKLFSSMIAIKPDELGISGDMLKFGPVRIQQNLVATIVRAARETQADPVLLMAIADKESSFVASISASTSSAVGLFQFVEATWFKVLRDFGADHGLAREATLLTSDDVLSPRERARILDLRKNPYLAALMAAEMLKKDAAEIGEKLGRTLSNEEIYLAHFLGPADAYKFLDRVDNEPKLVAAKLLPKPARANRPIFFASAGHKSKSLSVAEVHQKIEQAMGLRLNRYRNVSDAVPTATAYR